MEALRTQGKDILLPTRIRQIYINPKHHLDSVHALNDGRKGRVGNLATSYFVAIILYRIVFRSCLKHFERFLGL
jgi:hypothetical protein